MANLESSDGDGRKWREMKRGVWRGRQPATRESRQGVESTTTAAKARLRPPLMAVRKSAQAGVK